MRDLDGITPERAECIQKKVNEYDQIYLWRENGLEKVLRQIFKEQKNLSKEVSKSDLVTLPKLRAIIKDLRNDNETELTTMLRKFQQF